MTIYCYIVINYNNRYSIKYNVHKCLLLTKSKHIVYDNELYFYNHIIQPRISSKISNHFYCRLEAENTPVNLYIYGFSDGIFRP